MNPTYLQLRFWFLRNRFRRFLARYFDYFKPHCFECGQVLPIDSLPIMPCVKCRIAEKKRIIEAITRAHQTGNVGSASNAN